MDYLFVAIDSFYLATILAYIVISFFVFIIILKTLKGKYKVLVLYENT
jgi:hypothetical protein